MIEKILRHCWLWDEPSARAPPSAKVSVTLGLTQREVAMLMASSERAVRNIERRAMTKLSRHPLIKSIWREYSESTSWTQEPDLLTPEEVEALVGLATTWRERRLVWKVLDLIGQPPA